MKAIHINIRWHLLLLIIGNDLHVCYLIFDFMGLGLKCHETATQKHGTHCHQEEI